MIFRCFQHKTYRYEEQVDVSEEKDLLILSLCRYGLGMIYYKQEKFNLAEMHFKKALSINPQSSVLLCHIGVVSFYLTRVKTYCKKSIIKLILSYL